MHKSLLLLVGALAAVCTLAQPLPDAVYDPRIASVRLAPSADWYSFPILYFGDTTTLTLRFDELVGADAPQSNFTVSLLPCDLNWEPARVLPVECYTGFSQLSLRDYRPSNQTRVPYRHYAIRFPEEGQQMKRSGNYLLQVFRDGDEDRVVLQQRFIVCENLASFAVKSPAMIQSRMPIREISLLLNTDRLGMADQLAYTSLMLLRNQRWQDAASLKPTFVLGQNMWRYDLIPNQLYAGGGQVFRHFNTSRSTLQLEQVAGWLPGDTLTALLKKEFPAPIRQPKLPLLDFNGGWEPLNENLLNLDSDVDGDYVWVQFRVESGELPAPVQVVGQFNNWRSGAHVLTYDPALRAYTGKFLLKQGRYDYALQTGFEENLLLTEGSAIEGENEYMALLYFLPPGERCHRLAGIWVINHL